MGSFSGWVEERFLYDAASPVKMTATVSLKVRPKPDTEAQTLTNAKKGGSVNVLLMGETWAYVTVGNYTGFVLSKYLK